MSLLDVISEIAGHTAESFGDWTARGFVAVVSASGLALGGLTAWLIATSPDPLHQPAWGLAVFASCILVGIIGLLLSLLHLIRNKADQLLGTSCVAVNAAAVLIPVFWLMAR